MKKKDQVRAGLVRFAQVVTSKSTTVAKGAPEDQLRAPLEEFFEHLGGTWGWTVTCTGEVPEGRLGRPDYAVFRNALLTGHVELKKPGTGAVAARFTGRDREQFKRFSNLPNVLYTDGNEWALYRSGQRVRDQVRLAGAVDLEAGDAVGPDDGRRLEPLLRDFLEWRPILPATAGGDIDLKGFAELLAPLCRLLRDEVADALQGQNSPVQAAARDWRRLLFPEATDRQFAGAYAQTVAFGLLLGRSLGADPLNLSGARESLAAKHNLMSRALRFLTDEQVRGEIGPALDLLLRVIGVVPPGNLGSDSDPWLHFYEDFLEKYDQELRRKAGVYYTPVEVVRAQVRLVDDLLTNRLGRRLGFAHSDVITLDPAAGTGTYLLGVIEHALARVEEQQGPGALAGQATSLARRLHGFEIMVGPYSVSELRVSRAIRDREGELPEEGTHVYLADTLDSPEAEPQQLGMVLQPIADQRNRAVDVKKNVPVLVCLGNPPYHRHPAVDPTEEEHLAASGGWVRFGERLPNTERFRSLSPKAKLERRQEDSLLADFTRPVSAAGRGEHLKNLYNSYVYFWRWALWKVFEQNAASGPGIVSFITASSYLFGDAFVGVREQMRRVCDEVWILDIGGEGRGARQEDNVFAIQTPVAIAVLFRSKGPSSDTPARVLYRRIKGTRAEKLRELDRLTRLGEADNWNECLHDWSAPFLPAGQGRFFSWPDVTDLLPWQHSGVQLKRTWPIAPDRKTLDRRWRGLLSSENRAVAFRETDDRTVSGVYVSGWSNRGRVDADTTPIARVAIDASLPTVVQCGYRSFDRQRLIADNRLISRPRPSLWNVRSERQVYFVSQLSDPLGNGPAMAVSADTPDLHYFSGRGAKDVIPLYRSTDGSEAKVPAGLLDLLGRVYGQAVSAEDFASYVYGTLAHPGYTRRFFDELESRQVRVPLTKDGALFDRVAAVGRRLIWLHTYGERFASTDFSWRNVGKARCVKAVPGSVDGYPSSYRYDEATHTLHVGDGTFAPVSREVHDFDVSGHRVVQSWLGYRMKAGAGKSPPRSMTFGRNVGRESSRRNCSISCMFWSPPWRSTRNRAVCSTKCWTVPALRIGTCLRCRGSCGAVRSRSTRGSSAYRVPEP